MDCVATSYRKHGTVSKRRELFGKEAGNVSKSEKNRSPSQSRKLGTSAFLKVLLNGERYSPMIRGRCFALRKHADTTRDCRVVVTCGQSSRLTAGVDAMV